MEKKTKSLNFYYFLLFTAKLCPWMIIFQVFSLSNREKKTGSLNFYYFLLFTAKLCPRMIIFQILTLNNGEKKRREAWIFTKEGPSEERKEISYQVNVSWLIARCFRKEIYYLWSIHYSSEKFLHFFLHRQMYIFRCCLLYD